MAGSDIKAVFISDENASDDDRLVTAARPNTSATMANTTFAGGGARNVTVTTTGTGDNGKTNTIVGTDVFGEAQTEVITSTGSAETVAGTKLFLTVTSVTSSAQFAANIKVGSGDLCAQAINSRMRVFLLYLVALLVLLNLSMEHRRAVRLCLNLGLLEQITQLLIGRYQKKVFCLIVVCL